MSYILTLDVDTAIRLIRKAFEMREEERAYQLYASVFPQFNKNNFKKFSEFYKTQTQPISTRSTEEILAEANEILKKAGEMRGDI